MAIKAKGAQGMKNVAILLIGQRCEIDPHLLTRCIWDHTKLKPDVHWNLLNRVCWADLSPLQIGDV